MHHFHKVVDSTGQSGLFVLFPSLSIWILSYDFLVSLTLSLLPVIKSLALFIRSFAESRTVFDFFVLSSTIILSYSLDLSSLSLLLALSLILYYLSDISSFISSYFSFAASFISSQVYYAPLFADSYFQPIFLPFLWV